MSGSRSAQPASQYEDFHAVATVVQDHVADAWKATLEGNAAKLADAYARGGDMAYGT